METAEPTQASNPEPQKRPLETKPDEYCARAMAEAERVVRELSSAASSAPRSNPGRSSAADEKNEQSPLFSPGSGGSQAALPSVDHLRLDRDLDFVVHNDGVVELTEVGFRRLGQAHAAGLGVVLAVDGREVLRFPGPNPRYAPCPAWTSTEVAPNLIKKERERHKVESLLPWHVAGTLSRRDAERVEQVLKEDSDLARRYELVREERVETIRLNEMLGIGACDGEAVRRDRSRGVGCNAHAASSLRTGCIAGVGHQHIGQIAQERIAAAECLRTLLKI